ncbi:MAG: tRNA 4-thiouridine(8) synthase ThiI [Candidatus Omnitrophica bacterium]|nr:tRNA 4-thiouridine(8) synthase ThiI [Candidatus Omnitrophota bacterium]
MKAVSLVSAGLDSLLAARIIQNEGIKIIPLFFKTPFNPKDKLDKQLEIIYQNLRIKPEVVSIEEDFLEILKKPCYGFGQNMNPCIDCKILMFTKAKALMSNFGAEFVITGEVLGQRPMSQNRQALKTIEKKSGLKGLVLRPLSAKLLPPALPENKGWIKKENLFAFYGRSRKPQLGLAKQLRINNYLTPAGGCLLTDPGFAKRLKELILHQELSLDNIELLKVGRHFRIFKDTKLIVGRNEKENNIILDLVRKDDHLFSPSQGIRGPVALGRGSFNEGLIELSCRIICRYFDLDSKTKGRVVYKRVLDKKEKIKEVTPIDEDTLLTLRI